MTAQSRFLWIWMGLAVFITVVFSGIYLWYAVQTRTEEFRARAELLAWTFADRAAFDIARGNDQDLEFLAGTLVLGNVLYAQVIHEGQVLAEVSRMAEPLAAATAPSGVWQIEHRRSPTQAYWEIRRSLPDVDGYVRLGLALEPLENAIRSQLVLIAGISIAFIALAGFVTVYWARRLFISPALSAPVPVTGSPSSAASIPTPALTGSSIIQLGELTIDDASKRVRLRGEPVELSPKEFELLRLLASEPGRVYSNEEILSHVWTGSHFATAQDVKQYIYFLRQKLEVNPKEPQLILTVRGFGYKLQA